MCDIVCNPVTGGAGVCGGEGGGGGGQGQNFCD